MVPEQKRTLYSVFRMNILPPSAWYQWKLHYVYNTTWVKVLHYLPTGKVYWQWCQYLWFWIFGGRLDSFTVMLCRLTEIFWLQRLGSVPN